LSSKVLKYPGVEVGSRERENGTHLLTSYRTELKYAWSAGVATGRYLRGLKRAEIWGRTCYGCGRTLVPPRMYCERCFKPTSRWVKLEDTGRVVTYSVSYVNADASRRKEPIIVAVIEIDGASPLVGILHTLGEVEPDDVKVGMKVRAVWKDERDREGAITDIRYFRPLKAEADG